MPTLERCIELIKQGSGTIEEKYECASMTYWGNIVPVSMASYAPIAETNLLGYVEYPPEAADQLRGGNKDVNCKTCNCGGGGASAASVGGGAAAGSGAGGYVSIPGVGSLGASASMLLVAIIIGVMIARKG